ncbi:MAG: thioredoxin domain-containing protein [Myxococcota bacterium]|nr:thioredoxin domain-containing protein [Myxococcota bacterium]
MPANAQIATKLPGAEPIPSPLVTKLERAFAGRDASYAPRTHNIDAAGNPLFTNRLLLEASPYLRQHAHNPVDWHPWGDEAFDKAKRLGRPVLVSIGYSTCHWCHVMEEESFDDIETAKLINANFIAIKIDRETRPDIDAIYMAAIHAMGRRGGWPLNVFVTPDRKPFYAGTYFPPEESRGRPSFARVLTAISERWKKEPADLKRSAQVLTSAIQSSLETAVATQSQTPEPELRRRAVAELLERSDTTWGGVGSGTKFPSSLPLRFVMREQRRMPRADLRAQILLTLEKMATGGMRDHIGGGFHRYATERRWLVPHFEKMLYDNAQLARTYTEAWRWSGDAFYAEVARDTLTYLDRDMSSPEGGFYSATDADSLGPNGEMEEGWYFTWTPRELENLLGKESGKIAAAWWGIVPAGNFEGRTIPHTWRSESEVAKELDISITKLRTDILASREALRLARSKRPAPLRDDKQLAAWNALAISAFARAGFAFSDEALLERARRAARFVLTSMREPSEEGKPGRLHRVFVDGRADGPAFLSDYAFLIDALIDLYESDANPHWLREAIELQRVLDTHSADDLGGGYFRTAHDGEVLLAREKPSSDDVVPSGNAAALSALLRLYELTSNPEYSSRAAALVSALTQQAASSPSAFGEFWVALDFQESAKEVVIVKPLKTKPTEIEALLEPLRRGFPDAHVLAVTTDGPALQELTATLPLVAGKRAIAGAVTAYVCQDRVCALPTADPKVFAEQLGLRDN